MKKVLGIINQKGGAGKTTSTIEIANNLAVFEKKVLVIDLDPQLNLSKYIDVDLSKPSIYEVLHGDVPVVEAIQHIGRIDVIPASENLSKAEREFIGVEDVFLLQDLVEVIPDEYEYILVDSGPGRNILLNMIYVASDYLIVSCITDAGSMYGVDKVYRDIKQLRDGKRKVSHATILCFILNDYHVGWNNDTQKLANLNYLKSQMEDSPEVYTVRTFTGAKECKDVKMAIMDYDKSSHAAIDFRNLTYDLIEKVEERA